MVAYSDLDRPPILGCSYDHPFLTTSTLPPHIFTLKGYPALPITRLGLHQSLRCGDIPMTEGGSRIGNHKCPQNLRTKSGVPTVRVPMMAQPSNGQCNRQNQSLHHRLEFEPHLNHVSRKNITQDNKTHEKRSTSELNMHCFNMNMLCHRCTTSREQPTAGFQRACNLNT